MEELHLGNFYHIKLLTSFKDGNIWIMQISLIYFFILPTSLILLCKLGIELNNYCLSVIMLFYRSGLAVKNFIDVGAGVVDEDYRGILKVVLFNHSDADFEVKKGDRIAQLICEKIYYPELEEVKELTDTERGEGGFGSTGTK